MKILSILFISFFISNSYSFEIKLDLESITDVLDQVTEELSENTNNQEKVQVKEKAQTSEEVQAAEEKEL